MQKESLRKRFNDFIATLGEKSVLYCSCQCITFGYSVINQSLCCLVSLGFFPIDLHAVKSAKQRGSVQNLPCFLVHLPDTDLHNSLWGALLHRKWLTTYCLFYKKKKKKCSVSHKFLMH